MHQLDQIHMDDVSTVAWRPSRPTPTIRTSDGVSDARVIPQVLAPSTYAGKRVLDLALLLVSAPVWIPALFILAVLVRVRLGGPVLFRQVRTGQGERSFELLKFRSMTDARDANGELLPDADRLTAFGKRLRETSLDELPEILNVLRGDMSLVGPRPLLPRYVPLYSSVHRRRHDVPPGLTGLAQVAGRNALGWSERFDLDVDYVEHNSLWRDLAILARTVVVVLFRRGISADGEATMAAFTGYEPEPTAPSASPRSLDPAGSL